MKSPTAGTSTMSAADGPGDTRRGVQRLLYFVYFIYFFCGMTQSFESVILPELKEYFHLGYQQQMYVVFAKNIPFLLCPVLAMLVQRAGYFRSIGIALGMYAIGTWLLAPGLQSTCYAMVLFGFGIIGTGFTLQMIAGNPVIGMLGLPDGASSRLNLGNALGAIGQILAPAALTLIIPAAAVVIQSKIPYIIRLLLVLGALLTIVTAIAFRMSNVSIQDKDSTPRASLSESSQPSVWRNRALLGSACIIFLVLGAEASLFSLFRNFLEDPKVASLSSHASESLFTLYFALFAAGRLSAAWLQTRVPPMLHLVMNVVGALASIGVLMFTSGFVAVVAVLALGFFVSIFFPTLYALALPNSGNSQAQASGMLTFGFLGAAVIPVVQGRLADYAGLQRSYFLEGCIYLLVLVYAARSVWSSRSAEKQFQTH